MRNELLYKLHILKKKLSTSIPSIDEEYLKKQAKEHWNSYQPTSKKAFAIAEDGSVNKKKYLGFYLFSVCGYSYGDDGNTSYENTVGEIGISVIKNTERVDSYFKLLMYLTELKALLKLAKQTKPELLLIDGTLTSKFIIPAPKTGWFTKREFSGELAELSGELIPLLKEVLYKYDIAAFSEEVEEKVVKLAEDGLKTKPTRDIIEAFVSKLAYFEYFLLLYDLFYSLDWHPTIVGVAKTSSDTEIFKAAVPDISIFYRFINDTGYSKPLTVSFESKAKAISQEWEFSQVFEKREKDKAYALREVSIQFFYARYDNAKNISLLEVYEDPAKQSVNPEEILDYLNYLSVNGYPFFLIKADREARITNKDMELIESILGLQKELRGREPLL